MLTLLTITHPADDLSTIYEVLGCVAFVCIIIGFFAGYPWRRP